MERSRRQRQTGTLLTLVLGLGFCDCGTSSHATADAGEMDGAGGPGKDGSSDASADATGVHDAHAGGDAQHMEAGEDAARCMPDASAFYVATTGSDSNACTFAAPCLTFEKAQAMMMASSTVKTTYVRGGTYVRTAGYTFNDGENWLGYPCDPPHSATIDATGLTAGGAAFQCDGCSDVVMYNFTFSGAPTYNGGAWSDTNVLIQGGANDVYIDNNVFTGNLAAYNETDIYSFNSNNIYIRGNTFLSSASGEPISTPYTQAGTYSGLFITDNVIAGCQRWCIESQIQLTTITVSDLHIDRNTLTGFEDPKNQCSDGDHFIGAISAAGPASTSVEWNTGSTIWGNTLTVPSTTTSCIWGIEIGWTGTSVEYNTFADVGVAMAIGGMPGTEMENNTLTLITTGSQQPGCGGGACAFIEDGGYNGLEWIGTNSINGTKVTGCASPFCAFTHAAYGTKPMVNTPSAPYNGLAP
jgi:hypothetical protein